jgi:hypothetical protein
MSLIKNSPPDLTTKLYLPNHMVEANYNYSTLQEKIFNHIVKYLQYKIKEIRESTVTQLVLFEGLENNELCIKLELSKISSPKKYQRVFQAALAMAGIVIEVPIKVDKAKEWREYRGLFTRIEHPRTTGSGKLRHNYFYCYMHVSVAELICKIEKRPDGQIINFTTFIYEIAMAFKCKYTPRIYKMLCSYRTRPGFQITIDELRLRLNLGDKYPETNDFIKRVIKPAEIELRKTADLFFDSKEHDFISSDGKGNTVFNFRILSPDTQRLNESKKALIINKLTADFKFKKQDLLQIDYLLNDPKKYVQIFDKMQRVLEEYYKKDNDNKIKNLPMYTITALKNYLQPGA